MPKLETITPILSVRDVGASIAYYTSKLGFTDHWEWGEPTAFGGVSRDGVEILFCKDRQGCPGTWLSVWVDDVDAWSATSRRAGPTSASHRPTSSGACAR